MYIQKLSTEFAINICFMLSFLLYGISSVYHFSHHLHIDTWKRLAIWKCTVFGGGGAPVASWIDHDIPDLDSWGGLISGENGLFHYKAIKQATKF